MRYITLLLLIIITSCSPQPKDCNKFRTGTFKYPDSQGLNMIITRNDSIQIEIDEKTNDKLIGSIKWLSDCQYTLTYTEVSDSKASSLIGVSFTVDITNTSKDSYTYHAYNSEKEMTGKIIKIKETDIN